MTCRGLKKVLTCNNDFDCGITAKVVLEALLFKAEAPHRQRILAAEESIATTSRRYVERAYKYRPVKVVEFELPLASNQPSALRSHHSHRFGSNSSAHRRQSPSSALIGLDSFSRNPGEMLRPDMHIVTSAGVRIPAHSFVLAEASHVLASIISSGRVPFRVSEISVYG
ncbi:hypothetical protein QQ045_025040 [Rhodiola kirilowii]